MSTTEHMDPFWGNGEIDLPTPKGIAATWPFLKAQCGNTHPGACLPFGMISAGAYSGGYPTGYGTHAVNTHARTGHVYESPCVSGFTHLQVSGTGAIKTYYNYIKVSPYCGEWQDATKLRPLLDEQAEPGYYACRIGELDVEAELTVSQRSAHHRCRFPVPSQSGLVIDFSAGGIPTDGEPVRPEEAVLEIAESSICGYITMLGIRIYLDCRCPNGGASFFLDSKLVEESKLSLSETDRRRFGVVIPRQESLSISFSLQSQEKAVAHADLAATKDFDQHRSDARAMWENYGERITIETDDPELKEIFYSALYHSLIKPIDATGEHPDGSDNPYCYDFATMWDQYKTVLPLIMTIHPEQGENMVRSLLEQSIEAGCFLNCVQLRKEHDPRFDEQARGLLHCTLLDAFHRGFDLPWQNVLDAMVRDLKADGNKPFFEDGMILPVTHTLDLAMSCHCTAVLAEHLGQTELAKRYHKASGNWKNVYDPQTGRLMESVYYEGGLWNYSFRLLHDMQGRIDCCQSTEGFVKDLDAFFGYGAKPIRQAVDPADRDYMQMLHACNRFEGFNNEPDMETPYAYIYAGRHDRTAEVVHAGIEYMFTAGPGGAPGNVDSGGLSSCYVWNVLGLFPATTQPYFLIGSPSVKSTTIKLGKGEFTIRTDNLSKDNIYVQSAKLNGKPHAYAWVGLDVFLQGGTLELAMGPEPSGWGLAPE